MLIEEISTTNLAPICTCFDCLDLTVLCLDEKCRMLRILISRTVEQRSQSLIQRYVLYLDIPILLNQRVPRDGVVATRED